MPPSDTVSSLADALRQSQIDVETEKADLVRTLHDDLGSLLVGSIMDIGAIASQPGLPTHVQDKLERAQKLMHAAIDINRELIEKIRPTLLDNVGLFSTLRWHMHACCEAASIPYQHSFPDAESIMTPEIRIGVFRIVQEALKHLLAKRRAGDLSLKVEVIGGILHCHLVRQSGSASVEEIQAPAPDAAMHHRAARVGGSLQWRSTLAGRHMHLQVPLR